MEIRLDSKDVILIAGAIATVITAINGIVLLYFKRRQDKILDKKATVEIEALEVDISAKVLKIVNDQWTRDKLQWAQTRGRLTERTNLLLRRVEKLERQQELNILASTTHKAWDDQVYSIAKTVDPHFPPPPPILHPDSLSKDPENGQLMLDIEEMDHEL